MLIERAWQKTFRQNSVLLENLWVDSVALSRAGIQSSSEPVDQQNASAYSNVRCFAVLSVVEAS